jgi:TetR/AcrR family transcriptional regulator, regulator of cefoperazone and chloramphenicol sensitivity
MNSVKRRYRSPKREHQARQTREQIVGAARLLFARDGFAGTTVEAIAREAGVSAQTVYASVGSKRAIVGALIDRMEVEGGSEELRRELTVAEDPREQLRAIVRFNRRLFERGQDILRIVMATRVDSEMESLWQEGEVRRREGQARWVRAWSEAGVLRADLGEGEAADVLWALTGPEVYGLFVVDRGWQGDRFEEWLFETFESRLFRPAQSDVP